MDSSELLSRQCDLLRRMANEEGVSNIDFSEQERKIVSKLKKMGLCSQVYRSRSGSVEEYSDSSTSLAGPFRNSRVQVHQLEKNREIVWELTPNGIERLNKWEADLAKQELEKSENTFSHKARRGSLHVLIWTLAVVAGAFLGGVGNHMWTVVYSSGRDEVRIELREPELVWDRDCWAVAGDVVATGKIAPVMHVTLSYDWKGRKNGQEGWIGVTVRDGVGKLKARLPHHTDKEAAPRLQFALHSWQPAYGGAFEVTGGE